MANNSAYSGCRWAIMSGDLLAREVHRMPYLGGPHKRQRVHTINHPRHIHLHPSALRPLAAAPPAFPTRDMHFLLLIRLIITVGGVFKC